MSKVMVVFEVTPTKEGKAKYLELAAKLKPMLTNVQGFLGGERFQSVADSDKLLSINMWESEEAAANWRNQVDHRMAQLEGREKLFVSYKITVAHVVREYSNIDRTNAPVDSNAAFCK